MTQMTSAVSKFERDEGKPTVAIDILTQQAYIALSDCLLEYYLHLSPVDNILLGRLRYGQLVQDLVRNTQWVTCTPSSAAGHGDSTVQQEPDTDEAYVAIGSYIRPDMSSITCAQ